MLRNLVILATGIIGFLGFAQSVNDGLPFDVLPLPLSCVLFVENHLLAYVKGEMRYGLYNLETNTTLCEGRLPGRPFHFHGFALSPDNRLAATLVDGRGIFVWETYTCAMVAVLPFPALAGDVAFFPDGELLVGTDLLGRKLSVWRTTDWEQVLTLPLPYPPDQVQLSRDGMLLATGAFDTIMLVDTGEWKVRDIISLERARFSVFSFSPDDKALVIGRENGELGAWYFNERRFELLAAKHEQGVLCISFATNGKVLASGGADAVVLLWDWPTKRLVFRLDLWQELGLEELIPEDQKFHARFAARVYSLSFGPDGTLLATSGVCHPELGCVQIWRLSPAIFQGP